MSLVTVAEVKAVMETGMEDTALQGVIDREEAAIIERCGAHYVAATTVTETAPGGRKWLGLRRGIGTISTVKEGAYGDTLEALTAEDYYVDGAAGMLLRLPHGSRWGELVEVVFVPVDDTLRRKAAILELVRIGLARTALKHESVAGEYAYDAPDWEAERRKVLEGMAFIKV